MKHLHELTPQDKIKPAAELDGWVKLLRGDYVPADTSQQERLDNTYAIPDYATSYDAIIPLIQKQHGAIKLDVEDCLEEYSPSCFWYDATPSQLLDALLVATGKAEV